MKNLFAAALLAWALPLAAHAQTENRSYVGLSAGAFIPTGDFGKADYFNNRAGFAKTGLHLALDGAHYFGGGRFGLAGQVAYADQAGPSATDLAQIGAGFTDAFGVDESTLTAEGRYRRLSGLVGPAVMLGSGPLRLEVRALVGVVKSLGTPVVTVQLEDNTDTRLVQQSSTSTVLGYQGGLGLHYALGERLGLVLRGDYLGTGDLTIQNDNRTNNAGRLSTAQPVAGVSTSLGVTLRLK